MRKSVTVYLKVIKVNIPRKKLNKLLKAPGVLAEKDLAKITQILAKIEVAENKILHIKSIVGRLALKTYD